MRAEAAGYPRAQATDTVPAVVPIREAWYSFPTGTDRNNEPLGTIVVRFTDPAATRNYYEIVAYQEQVTPTRRIRSQDFELDARGNAALAAEGDAEFLPATLVFSDQLFTGQTFELRAAFGSGGYASGGTINGQPVPPRLLGNVRVELRLVSRAYYQYRKSWTRHLYNQGTKGPGVNLAQLFTPRTSCSRPCTWAANGYSCARSPRPSYALRPGVTLSATWVYGTGNALTLAQGTYHVIDQSYGRQAGTAADRYFFPSAELYGRKNSFRMRAYHRLDVGATFTKPVKHGERTWRVGAYNAYSRHNPYYIYYSSGAEDSYFTPGQKKLYELSLFPHSARHQL